MQALRVAPGPTALGALGARLRARRPEIEQSMLARAWAISDPAAVGDPSYAQGLREAVSVGVGYALAGIETAPGPSPVPPALLAQARSAARNRVPLDTVLRRYVAGFALFEDFLLEIAAEAGHSLCSAELKALLRREALLLDRLIESVSGEYASEVEGRSVDSQGRRAEKVRMLLAGEPVELENLDYELDAWHIGAVLAGPGARTAIRDLAAALDRSLLVVQVEGGTLWAWLGGERKITSGEVLRLAQSCWPACAKISLGEPGQGLGGWRRTHRQARAAMPILARSATLALRYGDVALLAAALGDDVLAGSLKDAYVTPLREERDGGEASRRTLIAYFQSGQNTSSAAAILGVNRKTVSLRLQSVQESIGRSIEECGAELETALRLWEWEEELVEKGL